MADFIQGFQDGFIAREGEKYEYHVGGKSVGSYGSIDALVKAQRKTNGKQAQESKQSQAAETSTATDVAAKPARKSRARKTTK